MIQRVERGIVQERLTFMQFMNELEEAMSVGMDVTEVGDNVIRVGEEDEMLFYELEVH